MTLPVLVSTVLRIQSKADGFDFSAAFDGHGTGSVMQLTWPGSSSSSLRQGI
jgi:hypothetical protein